MSDDRTDGGSRGRVLCLGTSPTLQRTMLFDRLAAGETNRAAQVHEYASGKAVNAARVLHATGHAAVYLGQVGGDRGRQFRDDLDAAGVPHDLLRVPQPTRLCVTVVDAARRQATELIEETTAVGESVAGELLDRLSAHLAAGDVRAVVMSGSLAPGVPADFYARAVRLARGAGAATVVDARGGPLRAALAEGPTVAKPNRGELAETAGRPVESRRAMQEAMAAVRGRGAAWVVCTRGRDGATVCGEVGGAVRFWEVTTPAVEARNAVGSGDSFAAGLAAGLAGGGAMPEVCRYASACGAANAASLLAGDVDPAAAARLVGDARVREVEWDR